MTSVRFIVDASVERQVAHALRAAGYDTAFVPEIAPDASDEEILMWANSEQRVLVTADKDFGELVYRQRCVSAGVILLRLHGVPNDQKAQLVLMAISSYSDRVSGSFLVIEQRRLRIRPL